MFAPYNAGLTQQGGNPIYEVMMNLSTYLKSKGVDRVDALCEVSKVKVRTLTNWYKSGDEKRWVIDAMIEKYVRETIDN